MSALSVEHEPGNGYGWDELVRIWEETDAPEGRKVEIIEGIVTVPPAPSEEHNDTAELLLCQLYAKMPEGCGIYQTLGLLAQPSSGIYIPDLAVVPRSLLRQGRRVSADEAKLVVEITSRSNANNDRVKKLRGYATAGVPLYLLLDPWHSDKPTAVLYGQPDNGTYRTLQAVEYGEKLTLPEPFGLDIDTGTFPVR
ncbi:Uma2 family endonuclease [Actinacidiphila oryziradicis]|uniref:Uma2 family endonuclease n=1 Tax=Actinacidiphila oryziradicis TaxID=2571141 RepID=A0A4U0RTP0_9ACTN|nr:Uma2 family endonuclease [Actinacidiphila oryziradicis]TJZ98797.1 Uma2 family endonuclease [Actinacidiphila oryziradicis]